MRLPILDPDIMDLHDARCYERRQLDHLADHLAGLASHGYEGLHGSYRTTSANDRACQAAAAAFAVEAAVHVLEQSFAACPTADYITAALDALDALEPDRRGTSWRVWHPKWADQHEANACDGLVPLMCWPRSWPSRQGVIAAIDEARSRWVGWRDADHDTIHAGAVARLRDRARRGFETGLVRTGFPVVYRPWIHPATGRPVA